MWFNLPIWGKITMPLCAHVNERAFTPEQISRLISAFEDALTALQINDRNDPMAKKIAQAMIEIADADPDCTVAALRARTLLESGLV
jgi:hypothetical protein